MQVCCDRQRKDSYAAVWRQTCKRAMEGRSNYLIYVGDIVEGKVQPGELGWLSQEVVHSLLEVTKVSDVVVTETQGAA